MTFGNRARHLGVRLGLIALLVSGAGAAPGTVAAGYASTGTGPAVQRTWSIQPTPQIPNPEGLLSNISCTSASFCVAVGSNGPQPSAMAWNGHSWRFLPPLPAQTTGVSGVSCSSPAFCLVAGRHYSASTQHDSVLADIWNGTRWATIRQAQPAVGQFDDVSCSDPSACLVVGSTDSSAERSLADWWNGHRLSPVKVTGPGKGVLVSLLGSVSCSSPSACTAVGFYTSKTPGNILPLIERWNGTSLVRQMAAPAGGELTSVSCPGTGGCVAVGYGEPTQPPFAEIWHGTTWTLMKSPAVPALLSGVSCLSSTECSAVGLRWDVGGNNFAPFAERLSGTVWSVQPASQPSHSFQSELSGISCVQAGACIGVGSFITESQEHAESLAEEWDGTRWAVQSVPDRQALASGSFAGVSCAGPTACDAAGAYYSMNFIPLNESWNGTQWNYHSSPTPTSDDLIRQAIPAGISCPATNMCMEVGKVQGALDSHPWTARWNGTRWTTVWPPKLQHSHGSLRGDELSSVSCVSASSCVAVGSWNPGPTLTDPLAYAWNGTKWTSISPFSDSPFSTMTAVSCTSAKWCLGVGLGPGLFISWIAEAWNGSSWTMLPISGDPNSVNAVSCSSPAACTMVGTTSYTGSDQLTAERWNGAKWTAQHPAPLPAGASSSVFTGVSCASDTACTAVGSYTVHGTNLPLIQVWNGTSWTAEPVPPSGSGELAAVSCTAPSICTAVGTENINTVDQAPLVERSG